ncbi:JmjC domain-containing protein [Streptacidiphilus melanogenes]|uniref:JmjC domain-containing protein n=1 Tax=Streptacidiphilus melanogenes TaxID=411235 RepID=UPI0005AB6103|nr:cupin domain-containing protein [Streptacidiphilus melanogenes]
MDNQHPLLRLIDDHDLLGSYWNRRHGLFRAASPTDGLLDEAAVQSILDAGLLRWPYFTMLKEGQQPAVTEFTKKREVGGRPVGGFADPVQVRRLLADGATMKLSQIEDWHAPTRALMQSIEARLSAELKSYLFYTPRDNTGMLPHRDGSHVLAVQIAGAKEWRIYDEEGQIDSRSGLDVDVDSHSHRFVMEPGDVLYLPHGFPHVATAKNGTSLHLTFTITEPTPKDLVESLLSLLVGDGGGLPLRDHRRSPAEEGEAVTKALLDLVGSVDGRVLVDTAVAAMRDRTV